MEEHLQTLDELNRQNINFLLSISPWAIVGGLLFNLIGLWVFRKGRREQNKKLVWMGVALLVYPLFTMDPWPIWVIGILLCGLTYYFHQEHAGV